MPNPAHRLLSCAAPSVGPPRQREVAGCRGTSLGPFAAHWHHGFRIHWYLVDSRPRVLAGGQTHAAVCRSQVVTVVGAEPPGESRIAVTDIQGHVVTVAHKQAYTVTLIRFQLGPRCWRCRCAVQRRCKPPAVQDRSAPAGPRPSSRKWIQPLQADNRARARY